MSLPAPSLEAPSHAAPTLEASSLREPSLRAPSLGSPVLLRTLGILGMVTAPAMLVEAMRHGFQTVPNAQTDVIGATLYGLFAIGWFASILGLRALEATGRNVFGRVVIHLPLVTIPLAFGQTITDILKVDQASALYMVTDLAWPLSMLLTFIVSVTVLFAPMLRGWQRFVPLYCGISLPLSIALMVIVGSDLPDWVFALHTATGWALLGAVVFLDAPRREVRHVQPAVQPS